MNENKEINPSMNISLKAKLSKSDISETKNKSNSFTRLIEFDIIKCLAIFLVLWGHSMLHFSSEDASRNWVYQIISSFHMPLFMLISGFFSVNSLNKGFKEIFKKKFMQLIYPTITFGIIFLFADLYILGKNLENKEISEFLLFGFWFLKSCFLCYIITWGCLRIANKSKFLGCIIALFCSFILPVFKLNWMLPFFVFGYMLGSYFNKIKKYINYIFPVALILFVSLFLVSESQRSFDLTELKSSLISGDISVLGQYFTFQGYRILIGVLGSFTFISGIFLIKKWIDSSFLNRFFSTYGSQTLGIYVIQCFILESLLAKFIDLNEIDFNIFSFIITPISSILIMIVCYQIGVFTQFGKLKLFLWGKK